jgi:hypothetical protein
MLSRTFSFLPPLFHSLYGFRNTRTSPSFDSETLWPCRGKVGIIVFCPFVAAVAKPTRLLPELLKTDDLLKGAESQRLRTYSTSNRMVPRRDLDAYGYLLASGDLSQIKADFALRVARHAAATRAGPSSSTEHHLTPEAAATQELYALS